MGAQVDEGSEQTSRRAGGRADGRTSERGAGTLGGRADGGGRADDEFPKVKLLI